MAPDPTPDPTPATLDPENQPLYESLRLWRRRIAATRGVPPYVVLSNATLAGIARARPADLDALMQVKGIGPAKATTYGQALLTVLHEPPVAWPDDEVLMRLAGLLAAARYDVASGAPGALIARPEDGGPALAITFAPADVP